MLVVGSVNAPIIFEAAVPLNPPVIPPETVGEAQLYVVPAGTIPFVILIGEVVKFPALQIVAFIAFIKGFGLTVTIMVNTVPIQLPDVGVTVYVAYCTIFVGFVSVPEIFVCVVPVAPPVNPPETVGIPQLYVVPAGTTPFVPLVGVDVKVAALQIVAVIALIEGIGFIVTISVNVAPGQAPAVGVIVYVAY